MKRFLVFCAVGLSTAGWAYTPKTLILTNQCNKVIQVAVASRVMSIGAFYWATEGWFQLNPGQVVNRRVSSGRYPYIYAQLQNLQSLTRHDRAFCISGQAFTSRQYEKIPKAFILAVNNQPKSGYSCEETGGALLNGFQQADFQDNLNLNFVIQCP